MNIDNKKIDTWINSHILRAPISGRLIYVGIVQENQSVDAGQELFMVNPSNTDFFGEVRVPQYNMGKIRVGQRTLVKIKSFPFEQFGVIEGEVKYISDVAFMDSVFIAKISFDRMKGRDLTHSIVLKNGMLADAEIITEDSSLLRRFLTTITGIFARR